MQLVVSKILWDYGEDLEGFVCKQSTDGWLILNYWSPSLFFDGFYLISNNSIKSQVDSAHTSLCSRLTYLMKHTPEDLKFDAENINSILKDIQRIWKVIGIQTKKNGYNDLDIGVIKSITKNNIIYYSISVDGELDKEESKIAISDILVLTFGGRYETMLGMLVGQVQ